MTIGKKLLAEMAEMAEMAEKERPNNVRSWAKKYPAHGRVCKWEGRG
jgi:hypothetical protein